MVNEKAGSQRDTEKTQSGTERISDSNLVKGEKLLTLTRFCSYRPPSTRSHSKIVRRILRTVREQLSSTRRFSSMFMEHATTLLFPFMLLFIGLISFVSPTPAKANEAATQHVKVGIDEKLGEHIPMNLVFKDENGNDITLGNISNGKPLIIDMAYYTCPGICDAVLAGLTSALDQVTETPGKDFNVATVSFDPADNPAIAMKKKEQYWGLLRRPFPANDWRFLTGDSVTIHKLTDAMGFYFIRDKYFKFTHPTALIIVDKNGKITRYMYGTSFVPMDLKMALMEAQTGRPAEIISSVLAVCFSRDPSGNNFAFDALRVVGIGTLIFIAGFIVFLRSTKKRDMATKSLRKNQGVN